MQNYKQDFPLLCQNDIVYLDSAATTQRPSCVLEEMRDFNHKYNANPHRGIYDLSMEATNCYENARQTVANFVGAQPSEIIFTKNATESLNLIANSYGMENINAGDNILISIMEHHSNIVPWQKVASSKGGTLSYIYIGENYQLENPCDKITANTKIVSITHVSNVLGVVNDIAPIVKKAREVGAVVVLDASQSVPHFNVDVKQLDVDFMVFSGHKLMAPLGVGVLYGKKEILNQMSPFLLGGDMIEVVTEQTTTFAPLPQKFEAGTQNVVGAVGLAAAIKYINKIGYSAISQHDEELLNYAKKCLADLDFVEVYAPQDNANHIAVISFNIKGVHAHDVAEVLNSKNICIRVGHHCAQPLMQHLKIQSTCRVSFYIYNTKNDVDAFVDGLALTYKRFEKWL